MTHSLIGALDSSDLIGATATVDTDLNPFLPLVAADMDDVPSLDDGEEVDENFGDDDDFDDDDDDFFDDDEEEDDEPLDDDEDDDDDDLFDDDDDL